MEQIAEQKQHKDWPRVYRNSETGKNYKPHHDEELAWVTDTFKRYLLAKGGEGGGKSVAGIIRDLERIKAGAHGIMVSPDFEHFKRSLWPEFRRWCPWEFVVDKQQYRQSPDWEPGRPFQLVFITGAIVYCGGMKESDIEAWEGPNVNWAHFDEPRRHKTAKGLKVLDGRVRIPMGGYKPQMWLTSTPRMNWLYKFFGPWKGKGADPRAAFKTDSHVVTLLTKDNEENLEPGFTKKRAQTLTAAEVRVYLEAEWEDIDETQQFLPSMTLWDLCEGKLPPLTAHESMILALEHQRERMRVATHPASGWLGLRVIRAITKTSQFVSCGNGKRRKAAFWTSEARMGRNIGSSVFARISQLNKSPMMRIIYIVW